MGSEKASRMNGGQGFVVQIGAHGISRGGRNLRKVEQPGKAPGAGGSVELSTGVGWGGGMM